MLLDVRMYYGADIRSEHYLLMALLCLHVKKKKQEHQPARSYVVDGLRDQTIAEQYKLEHWFQLLQHERELKDQWMEDENTQRMLDTGQNLAID